MRWDSVHVVLVHVWDVSTVHVVWGHMEKLSMIHFTRGEGRGRRLHWHHVATCLHLYRPQTSHSMGEHNIRMERDPAGGSEGILFTWGKGCCVHCWVPEGQQLLGAGICGVILCHRSEPTQCWWQGAKWIDLWLTFYLVIWCLIRKECCLLTLAVIKYVGDANSLYIPSCCW